MPTIPHSDLPRPKSWEEFEDIVWKIYSREWHDPHTERNGRSGQRQHGVDIFGQPADLGGRYAGIQCKRFAEGRLTQQAIEREVAEAEDFTPPPAEYTIATTESRDAAVQEVVRQIDEERRQAGKFRVYLVFWETVCDRLSDPGNADLLRKHYGDWLRHGSYTPPSAPDLDELTEPGGHSIGAIRKLLLAALAIVLLTIATTVTVRVLQHIQRPTAYMEIVLDNGPIPQPYRLDDLKTVLQKELSRALPDAALALRVFGPRCGETRQVVHFSTGNATEVVNALGDVYPEAQADLTEAIRQAINDLLKRKGDQPRVVVAVTWGREGCGEDLEQALASYRKQLGTSVALYILNRGDGSVSISQPGVYAVQTLNDMQLGTVISDLKGALAAGRWPPTPMPTPTGTYTPTPTDTPTPTTTPTRAASGTPRTPVPRSASAISVDNAVRVSQAAVIDAVRGEDLDWSPDGTLLALTAGYEVLLYDAQGSPVRVIKMAGWSTHAAFSPDGATLAVASDKGVGLWEAATGAELGAVPGIPRAADVAFSPDGTLLAVAAEETVKVVEVASGQEPYLLIHGDGINSVAFSPDGKMVASSSNYEVKLWLLGQEEAVQTLKRGTGGWTMAFSPDGKLLATDEGQTIKLWDVASGLGQGTLSGHSDAVSSVAFSPDGTVLASASADLTVRLWDMAKRHELRSLDGHTDGVLHVVFSPDGAVVASASSDRTIRLWSVPPGGVNPGLD